MASSLRYGAASSPAGPSPRCRGRPTPSDRLRPAPAAPAAPALLPSPAGRWPARPSHRGGPPGTACGQWPPAAPAPPRPPRRAVGLSGVRVSAQHACDGGEVAGTVVWHGLAQPVIQRPARHRRPLRHPPRPGQLFASHGPLQQRQRRGVPNARKVTPHRIVRELHELGTGRHLSAPRGTLFTLPARLSTARRGCLC